MLPSSAKGPPESSQNDLVALTGVGSDTAGEDRPRSSGKGSRNGIWVSFGCGHQCLSCSGWCLSAMKLKTNFQKENKDIQRMTYVEDDDG